MNTEKKSTPPGYFSGELGLERAKRRVSRYAEENGKSPTSGTRGFGHIYKLIKNGNWEDYGIKDFNDLIRCCGLEPSRNTAWSKWEAWCEKVLKIVYPQELEVKPRLPNGYIPDFRINIAKNYVLIIDAKLSITNMNIRSNIENYCDYCDKLEFWCLLGQRPSEKYIGKEISFLEPIVILKQIKDKNKKEELARELEEIEDYRRKEFSEITFNKEQKKLDQWL